MTPAAEKIMLGIVLCAIIIVIISVHLVAR